MKIMKSNKKEEKKCPMCGSRMEARYLKKEGQFIWFCMKPDAKCAYCEDVTDRDEVKYKVVDYADY